MYKTCSGLRSPSTRPRTRHVGLPDAPSSPKGGGVRATGSRRELGTAAPRRADSSPLTEHREAF